MTLISLSRAVAWVRTEAAVFNDMPFETVVEPIKSREERKAPLERHPLPFIIVARVEGVSKIPNPDYDPYWERHLADPAEGEGAEIYKLLSAAEQLSRELEALDDEEGQLMDTFEASREAQEALEKERVDAIVTGKILGARSMRRPPSQRGRTQVPFPWLPVLGGLAIAVFVFLESYSFSVLFHNMVGVDVSRLGKEWQGNPIGVAGGAGLALTASVLMFLLWYWVIYGTLKLSGSWRSHGPGMTGVKAVGVLLLGVTLVIFSVGMAHMRWRMVEDGNGLQQSPQAQAPGHGETTSETMGQVVFFLLTLLMPLGAAFIQHRISASAIWERRRELNAERERWDREERARQLASERLAERTDLLQAKRNDIERRRDALRAKRRALEARIQTLAQQRLIDLERERRDGVRFATGLFDALVQSRADYVRAAMRRKKYHLLAGQPWDCAHEHSLALVPRERSNGRHATRHQADREGDLP